MAVYQCIREVSDYLIGKGFTPDSFNYRYFYYTDSVELQLALTEMPSWMRNSYAPPWEG